MIKGRDRGAELNLRSFAKVNLSLDVTGIRDDGYHLVETVMQQVSLYDEINIRWEPVSGKELEITVSNTKPYLPRDGRNLAYKAALIMAEQVKVRTGKRPQGILRMHIKKHIPVAAGLGGGSSNAATVMMALNRIWSMGMDTRRLCQIGASLGADVPFCILVQNSRYTCALCTGIGEVLNPIKRGMNKHLVLVKPAFGVSTKEVFGEIDSCTPVQRPETEVLAEGISRRDMSMVYPNMINVLESYTLKHYPEVKTLKEKLDAAGGAKKVLMSGSGPTVIGIYNRCGAARRVCLEMRKQGYEAYWAYTGKDIRGDKNAEL